MCAIITLEKEETEDLYKKYCSEINRLDSFKYYKSTDCNFTKQVQQNYARAGLFWIGVDEEIKCNFCNFKIKRLLKNEEDPIKLHCRYNSTCPFICRQRTDNIPIDEQLLNKLLPEKITFVANTQRSKFPKYSTSESRFVSFRRWPSNSALCVQDLVSAGFYYLGDSDKVGCFYCGLGLQKFSAGDIPLEIHKQLRSECVFIQNLAKEPVGSEVQPPSPEKKSQINTNLVKSIIISSAFIIVGLVTFHKYRSNITSVYVKWFK